MITSFLLKLLLYIVILPADVLPTTPLPSDLITAVNTIWNIMQGFSYILPMQTLLTCVTYGAVFQLTLWALDAVLYAARYLRGD